MSLFDFFFPQQAQANYLRNIVAQKRARAKAESRGRAQTTDALQAQIGSLENDLGYVALVLASVLQVLDAKGVVSRDDVRGVISELDELDGVADGKLDINILRGRNA